jgi:predicted nucleic acid-binding protein
VIGLDTSIVVRYLVGTPPDQAARAAALIDRDLDVGIPVLVLVETAHVLRTQYGVQRADVVATLIDLATRKNVVILGLSNEDTLEALVRARSLPRTPIPDALIASTARATGALPLYSFDADLRRHGIAVAVPPALGEG